MILQFRLTQLSPKWIAVVLGIVGVVLLGVSASGASQRIEKLRSWPRVDARVDSGDVVSFLRQGRREAMYAGRLKLQYEYGGQRYSVPATEEVYSSHYAGQARGVQQAIRDGRVSVLLDPRQRSAPVLNAGYNAEFFFSSLVFAWIGGLMVFLAAVFWRAFRNEAPGAKKNGGSGGGARWVAAFFAVLGVGFVGGGVTAFWLAHREATTWKPVEARIDSTDVVWRSSRSSGSGSNRGSSVDLYAARAWITYSLNDSAYHVPVVRGAYSNNSGGAAKSAALLRRSGSMTARVDPGNPFDAALKPPGAVSRFWFPALFIVPGLVCLFLTWLIGRGRKKRKPRRPKPRTLPLIIVSILALTGFAHSTDRPPINFERFTDDIGTAGQIEMRRVFKTAAAYQSYFGHSAPSEVDFSQDWVVFYSAGEQAASARSVSITRIVISDPGLTLKVTTSLSAGCMGVKGMAKKYVLVKFKRPSPTPDYISYYRDDETRPCLGDSPFREP